MGEVVQFVAPSRTITETIGDRTITYTFNQELKRWDIVIRFTEQKEMIRHAETLEKARRLVSRAIETLDKINAV